MIYVSAVIARHVRHPASLRPYGSQRQLHAIRHHRRAHRRRCARDRRLHELL